MKNKKFSYREIERIKQEDIKAKRIRYAFHRHFSTLFTYIFIKLNISPNTITLLTFLISIFGFIFLSIGTYTSIFIGMIFFNLVHVIDCSDGEVARLQNKKSIEGVYLDEISHYVYACSLGLGLGYGLLKLYSNEMYIFLGFILALIFVLEYAVVYAQNSVIMREALKNKIYKKMNSEDKVESDFIKFLYDGHSWGSSKPILKIFGIYPFQGLFFSVYFILPIIMVLVLAELFLNDLIWLPITVYNQKIGLLSLYLFLLSLAKSIWIFGFVSRIVKKKYITRFLNR